MYCTRISVKKSIHTLINEQPEQPKKRRSRTVDKERAQRARIKLNLMHLSCVYCVRSFSVAQVFMLTFSPLLAAAFAKPQLLRTHQPIRHRPHSHQFTHTRTRTHTYALCRERSRARSFLLHSFASRHSASRFY